MHCTYLKYGYLLCDNLQIENSSTKTDFVCVINCLIWETQNYKMQHITMNIAKHYFSKIKFELAHANKGGNKSFGIN